MREPRWGKSSDERITMPPDHRASSTIGLVIESRIEKASHAYGASHTTICSFPRAPKSQRRKKPPHPTHRPREIVLRLSPLSFSLKSLHLELNQHPLQEQKYNFSTYPFDHLSTMQNQRRFPTRGIVSSLAATEEKNNSPGFAAVSQYEFRFNSKKERHYS